MRRIATQITIEAPARTVWERLTAFETHSEWNPFIISLAGRLEVGGKLNVRIQPPGKKPSTFKPTVTVVEPYRAIEWIGGMKGLFTGRHRFELHDEDSHTRFVHSEEFRGILRPLLMRSIGEATTAGFESMNEALKQAVEMGVSQES